MNRNFRGRSLGIALCSAAAWCLCFTTTASATTIASDDFDSYPNGTPLTAPPSPWGTHSGTAQQILVTNGEITLIQTTNSEDVNLPLGVTMGSGDKFYAAFDLRVPTATTVVNVYFAHFLQGTSNFRARVWIRPPAVSGNGYRLGISNSGTAPNMPGTDLSSTDLAFGQTYRVVTSYTFDGSSAELWIDPVNESSPKLTITGESSLAVTAYAFREATSSGNTQQIIDNLCIATTFNEVITCTPPTTGACCTGTSCTENVTQTACTNGGGTYLGDGSFCQPTSCQNGACCIPGEGGETCQQSIAFTCANTLGGFFQGAGVACTNPNPCGPVGSCCSADYSTCTNFLTVEECAFLDPNATWFQGLSCALACGPTGSCCELNGTCTLNVTQAQCDASGGRNWTEDATSCTNCTAVVPQPVIISEYYEAAPGNRKALELYNTSAGTINLDGHRLALYANGSAVPTATFSLTGLTIAPNDVLVFINNADDDIDNFDENTAILAPGVMNFNGDDAIAILFIDASNVIDIFGIPTDGDNGPRGSDPYADSAWERKCFVTSGTSNFDSCNFDNLKDCGQPHGATCPRGVNPPLACIDGLYADTWVYLGLNAVGNNGNHTLGFHNDCSANPPTGACCPEGINGGGAEPRGPGACACPGDLNGDDVIDINDVPLFVTALLNNVYDACADMQQDNDDDGADIQAFVLAVLNQTTCGITECTVLTQAQCIAVGGRYLGDDTLCDPGACDPPTGGACCTTEGCVEGMSQAQCQSEGGYYFGNDSICAGNACVPDNSAVVINEIRIDQTGADSDEYFELAGAPGTLLTGLTYIVIGDSSGTAAAPGDLSGNIERVINLTGHIIPADGRFLGVTGTFTMQGPSAGHVPDMVFDPNSGGQGVFENSDNVTHMLVYNFTGALNDVIDDNRDGIPNAILPWDSINDWVSVIEMQNSQVGLGDEWVYDFSPAPGGFVGPDGTFAPGHVYRNDPNTNTDGAGTPWQIGPFNPVVGNDTPGIPNVIQGACCDGASCIVTTPADCAAAFGVYKGTGTTCDNNPCVGACCTGSTCQVLPEQDCLVFFGNVYLGDSTSCTPNPCAQTCSNIPAARALPVGSPARICGVISSNADLVGAGNKTIFLQDNNGPGGQTAITIFGPDATIDSILGQAGVGDSVELLGTLLTFNGLLELGNGATPLQFIANNGFVGVPPPIDVTVADFQDQSPTAEDFESELVRVKCVTFLDGDGQTLFNAGASGANYLVTDGLQTMVARVAHSGLDLHFSLIPVGPVNITGIFSQFDSTDPRNGGYQLLMRSVSDIEFVQPGDPECITPIGACCTFDDCIPNTSHADCAFNFGGEWLGAGTNCDFGCPNNNASCLIISEVVDGDRAGGNPKYVEITNTGNTVYKFPAGGIRIYSNGSVTATTVDLTGVLINPGQSYVVAGSANDGAAVFASTYDANYPGGPIVPNLLANNINGNGDDVYALSDTADGSNIIDVYGEIGIDGTGTAWEYTDSVARRNPSASSPNGGVFDVNEWTIVSLDGANDAEALDLLRTHTTPKTHVYDPCAAQACLPPVGVRNITSCGGGGPACTSPNSNCAYFVDADSQNIPANCGRCTDINFGTVCVPCVGSCPQNQQQIFYWVENDCYFEGTIFSGGPCLANCSGPQGTFNDAN